MFQSELDRIPGVGEKRRVLLLTHFKSIEEIKNASLEEMRKIGIPKNIATEIIGHLKEHDKEKNDREKE